MEQIFGFVSVGVKGDLGTVMALGDQKILIAPNLNAIGSIRPHHVALSVPDTDAAMNACMARGGKLVQSMTPDGPLEIPEFWGEGVRYVFIEGPEGALIELCMRKGRETSSRWGHDHIGIECEQLSTVQSLFESDGCDLIAKHSLRRSDGTTDVAFLKRGDSIAELFSPPHAQKASKHISRCGWTGLLSSE